VRRLRLLLEYDGTDFAGWQIQPGQRSVQGAVEEALREITGETLRIQPAGRTDAGVHARGQVAHVDTGTLLPPPALERALNAVLPRDVAVRTVDEVAADFHARHDATGKIYVYRILNCAAPSPVRARYSWHVRAKLDCVVMAAAAGSILGTHDFSAFRSARGGPLEDENPRRTLLRLDVTPRSDDEIEIVAHGRSFLRHMVRNLTGTLVEIGLGKCGPESMAAILVSRDRMKAAPAAPAHGLCLERVLYADDDVDATASRTR
jgi:tRNA pseudouridine38-40 synthase